MVRNLSLLLTLSGSDGVLMSFLGSDLSGFVSSSLLLSSVCQFLDISLSGSDEGYLAFLRLLLSSGNLFGSSFSGSLSLRVEVFDLLGGGLLCSLSCGCVLVGSFQPLLIESPLCLKSLFLLLNFLPRILGFLEFLLSLCSCCLCCFDFVLALGQLLLFLGLQLCVPGLSLS